MCFYLSDFLCCCPIFHHSEECSEGGGNCLFFNLPARKHEEMMCLWDSDAYLNHPKSPRHPHSPELREWHEPLLTELFELMSICYLTPMCSAQWQVIHMCFSNFSYCVFPQSLHIITHLLISVIYWLACCIQKNSYSSISIKNFISLVLHRHSVFLNTE